MQTLDLLVPDGRTVRVHVARPAHPAPLVVVLHELFGVNDDIRGVLADLAAAGYAAAAPELFFGSAPPGTALAKDEAGRAEGFRLLRTVSRADVVSAVRATVDALGQGGPVALVGFSVGGHAGWVAAAGLDLVAAVLLYPGWLPSSDLPLSRPEPTVRLVPRCPVTVLVGDADPVVPAADRAVVADRLRALGGGSSLVAYPGVGHAFVWPASPAYDPAAAADAWARVRAALPRLDEVAPA